MSNTATTSRSISDLATSLAESSMKSAVDELTQELCQDASMLATNLATDALRRALQVNSSVGEWEDASRDAWKARGQISRLGKKRKLQEDSQARFTQIGEWECASRDAWKARGLSRGFASSKACPVSFTADGAQPLASALGEWEDASRDAWKTRGRATPPVSSGACGEKSCIHSGAKSDGEIALQAEVEELRRALAALRAESTRASQREREALTKAESTRASLARTESALSRVEAAHSRVEAAHTDTSSLHHELKLARSESNLSAEALERQGVAHQEQIRDAEVEAASCAECDAAEAAAAAHTVFIAELTTETALAGQSAADARHWRAEMQFQQKNVAELSDLVQTLKTSESEDHHRWTTEVQQLLAETRAAREALRDSELTSADRLASNGATNAISTDDMLARLHQLEAEEARWHREAAAMAEALQLANAKAATSAQEPSKDSVRNGGGPWEIEVPPDINQALAAQNIEDQAQIEELMAIQEATLEQLDTLRVAHTEVLARLSTSEAELETVASHQRLSSVEALQSSDAAELEDLALAHEEALEQLGTLSASYADAVERLKQVEAELEAVRHVKQRCQQIEAENEALKVAQEQSHITLQQSTHDLDQVKRKSLEQEQRSKLELASVRDVAEQELEARLASASQRHEQTLERQTCQFAQENEELKVQMAQEVSAAHQKASSTTDILRNAEAALSAEHADSMKEMLKDQETAAHRAASSLEEANWEAVCAKQALFESQVAEAAELGAVKAANERSVQLEREKTTAALQECESLRAELSSAQHGSMQATQAEEEQLQRQVQSEIQYCESLKAELKNVQDQTHASAQSTSAGKADNLSGQILEERDAALQRCAVLEAELSENQEAKSLAVNDERSRLQAQMQQEVERYVNGMQEQMRTREAELMRQMQEQSQNFQQQAHQYASGMQAHAQAQDTQIAELKAQLANKDQEVRALQMSPGPPKSVEAIPAPGG